MSVSYQESGGSKSNDATSTGSGFALIKSSLAILRDDLQEVVYTATADHRNAHDSCFSGPCLDPTTRDGMWGSAGEEQSGAGGGGGGAAGGLPVAPPRGDGNAACIGRICEPSFRAPEKKRRRTRMANQSTPTIR